MSHLCPIGTNFNCPERQSSRTAKTVVDILRATVAMSIRKSSVRLTTCCSIFWFLNCTVVPLGVTVRANFWRDHAASTPRLFCGKDDGAQRALRTLLATRLIPEDARACRSQPTSLPKTKKKITELMKSRLSVYGGACEKTRRKELQRICRRGAFPLCRVDRIERCR
jgi:hypothetical protein